MADTKNTSTEKNSTGHQLWADAPRAQREAIRAHFAIPQSVHYDILPSPMLPIAKMLEFSLPLEALASAGEQPAQFFSLTAPDPMDKNSLARLRHLPIPAAKVVRKLERCGSQARLDGYQSLMYSHISSGVVTHFPLWVLTYWKTLVDFRRDVRGPWMKCQEWVRKQKKLSTKNMEKAARLEKTTLMISMLPWGWKKHQGLSDSEPYHTLWRFLGPNFLTGSQQNDMLELHHHNVDSDPNLAGRFRFEGVALIPKILEAFKTAGTDTYRQAKSFRWIRDLADDLVRKQAAVITTAHLGEVTNTEQPHWASIIIDLAGEGTIRYAEGFGTSIPANVLEACRWWMRQHTPGELASAELPMGQQEDGFSCGMLVDNSHAHFIDPNVPLSTATNWAQERCETFNKIAQRALELLQIERDLAIAADEDSDSGMSESGHYTATANAADSDDSDNDVAGRPPRSNFTFTFPSSPLAPTGSIPGRTSLKRAKNHPDAPTPTASPAKRRIYKRRSDSGIIPPLQPYFSPPAPAPRSARSRSPADVFGPMKRRAPVHDGYGTDSESEHEPVATGASGDYDEYAWGPEDDASLPPASESSFFDDTASESFSLMDPPTTGSEAAALDTGMSFECDSMPGLASCDDYSDAAPPYISDSECDDLPPLQDVSDSDEDASDASDDSDDDGDDIPALVSVSEDEDDDIPPYPSQPSTSAPPKNTAAEDRAKGAKPTLSAYWKIETAAEKAVRTEREAREYREQAEENRLREVQEKRRKAARERVQATDRMQRFRQRELDAKIAAGYVPGQKRKRVELLEHDETGPGDANLAELSRPRRQFKEDAKKNNKLSGRKRLAKNAKRDAKQHNWTNPLLWSQIDAAARTIPKPWKPRAITRAVHKANYTDFHRLTEQVVGRWIEEGGWRWKATVLESVKKGHAPGGETTRCGFLKPYPEIRKLINTQLVSLRAAGVPLTLLTIRGIMVAHIQRGAPHLFERRLGDGSTFRCSEVFVRSYLRNSLNWSERRSTKAAQKLPANHEKLLEEAFLREAHVIRDYGVPAALRVNTDQTQLVYQQGSGSTWTQRGAKQVATVGQEEKRAFTLVPSISASGVLLPMQSVFGGMTQASCPSETADRYDEALKLGYTMVPSKTKTYWSNHQTMHQLVDDIIAPYFEATKEALGLPTTQISIWKIDCWSVHKSRHFLDWMKENHSNIIVLFVPGGCTGVWQPLDVGVQRVLKLSIKRSAHRDIVNEALAQMDAGVESHEIKLDTTVGVLRDRSVGWIVQAIYDIDDPTIITKAFEMCRIGDYNLSQASLTSREALAALRQLPTENPTLYAALTQTSANADTSAPVPADEEDLFQDVDVYDDCDIPLDVVASHVASRGSSVPEGFSVSDDGSLTRAGDAEKSDAEDEEEAPVALGRGHRVRTAARRYQGPIWEEH